jgi:hypothetical protein
MSVSRRGIDRSVFQRFTSMAVKAGVLEGATYPADTLTNAKTGEKMADPREGMKVATIAAALNYGNGQNHPRPFMNQAFAKHKKQWAADVVKLASTGTPVDEALTTVGQTMMEDIQDEIQAWPADNAKEWAEFKGFNHGLVLTSHLTNSIKYEVNKV